MEDTVKRFKEHLEKMRAINHASGVLYYDSDTVMPRRTPRRSEGL